MVGTIETLFESYILLVFTLLGCVFIALGVPLRQGKVPRNLWYGFRTRKSLSSDETWYAVNREAGKDMVQAGMVLLGASLAAWALTLWISLVVLVGILVLLMSAMLIRMTLHGYKTVRRY